MSTIEKKSNKKGRVAFMRKFIVLFVVCFIALGLAGCASLGEIAQDIQEVDATTEIAAVGTLLDDLIDTPWDNALFVGLGYLAALIRRKYKVSKGAR